VAVWRAEQSLREGEIFDFVDSGSNGDVFEMSAVNKDVEVAF
jgi:hypothetical protein